MEPIVERGDRHDPVLLRTDQPWQRRQGRRNGQNAGARHQKRGCERISFAFLLRTLRLRMLVEHQVAKLMSRVKSTMLGRLVCVQKDKRRSPMPHRERIDFLGINRHREDTDPLRFKQGNHILDWQRSDTPMNPEHFSRHLGLLRGRVSGIGFRLPRLLLNRLMSIAAIAPKVRNIRLWKIEALFYPLIQKQSYSPSA